MDNKKHNKNLESSLKILLKSSVFFLIGIFISKILSFIYRIIIARAGNLGTESYGEFNLAVAIFGFFTAIFSLGLSEGLLRYIPYYKGKNQTNKVQHLIRFTLKITTFTGILGGIVMFFLSQPISIYIFHDEKLINYLKLFSLFIPISIVSGVMFIITRAYEKIGWNSFITNILQPFSRIILLILLLFIGLSDNAVILSYNLGFLVVLISSYLICKKVIPEIFNKDAISKKIKKESTISLLSYSWPFIFIAMINLIFSGIDVIMIGYFKGVEPVGIYNAALPISALMMIVPTLFIQLFFPLISKEYARKNFNLIEDLSKQVTKWIFMVNILILLVLILFPRFVLNILFGKDYLGADMSLIFLSIGMFFFTIFTISERLLSMAGKTKLVLFNILISAGVNAILNYFLIPKYGIAGAAFATMVSYIVWGIISTLQAKKYVSIVPLRRKMIIIFICGIIPALILLYVKQFIPTNIVTIILEGLFLLLSYTFLILITGCLDRHDLAILKSIKDKLKL
jgi:stage V sporulation protein B